MSKFLGRIALGTVSLTLLVGVWWAVTDLGLSLSLLWAPIGFYGMYAAVAD